jgi:signal transduction histidine kinase
VNVTGSRGGWARRLPAPPVPLALLAALLVVIALSHDELPGLTLAGALLAPVAATVSLTTYPVASLGVCVPAALATALALGEKVPPWSVALGAALGTIGFLAGRRTPRPAPVLAVFATGAVLSAGLTVIDDGAWAIGLLLLVLTVVLPWSAGYVTRQQTDLAAAASERVHLRERTRIAHDMHDTLGHELSLLAVRAGVLELSPDFPEHHRAALAELRAGAGAATERLADIVRVLRDGEPAPLRPASDSVEDLVERAADAGMTVALEWEGPRDLPPMVDRAAHRVVQEALTNAAKHAPGSAVSVRVRSAEDTTTVTVTNTVTAGQRRGAGGGLGLAAMRERVRLTGGTLDAGHRDRTFDIVATLPHTEDS